MFNISYFNAIEKALYIDECKYHYRKSNQNAYTKKHKPNLPRQWDVLFEKMNQFIHTESLPDEFKEALNNRIAWSVVELGFNQLLSNLGAITNIKVIGNIISTPQYRTAVRSFKTSFLPLHWKVFFWFVKHRLAVFVYYLIIAGRRLKQG